MPFLSRNTPFLHKQLTALGDATFQVKSICIGLRNDTSADPSYLLRFVSLVSLSVATIQELYATPGLEGFAREQLGKIEGASWDDYPAMLSAIQSALDYATKIEASGKVVEQKIQAQVMADLRTRLDAVIASIA